LLPINNIYNIIDNLVMFYNKLLVLSGKGLTLKDYIKLKFNVK